MPQDVLEVTTKFIRDPVRILVKKYELTLEGIKQFYIAVEMLPAVSPGRSGRLATRPSKTLPYTRHSLFIEKRSLGTFPPSQLPAQLTPGTIRTPFHLSLDARFGRQDQRWFVVTFKCSRADIYYLYDDAGGAICEGGRGHDLGQVTHADVSMEDARKFKCVHPNRHQPSAQDYQVSA
jgi:hypothetical protein